MILWFAVTILPSGGLYAQGRSSPSMSPSHSFSQVQPSSGRVSSPGRHDLLGTLPLVWYAMFPSRSAMQMFRDGDTSCENR